MEKSGIYKCLYVFTNAMFLLSATCVASVHGNIAFTHADTNYDCSYAKPYP